MKRRERATVLVILVMIIIMAAKITREEGLPSIKPTERLQEIIDKAPEGAIIMLDKGVYYGPLILEKDITLIGKGEERTLISTFKEPAILIVRAEVRIENLTIAGIQCPRCRGVIVNNAKVIMKDVTVRDFAERGILSLNRSSLILHDVKIVNSSWPLSVWSSEINGANLRISDGFFCMSIRGFNFQHEILGLVIERCELGIEVLGGLVLKIHKALIRKCGTGISAWGNTITKLYNVSIRDNIRNGIVLYQNASIALFNSEVVRNGNYGIVLAVKECNFAGKYFYGARENVAISETLIKDNKRGDICPKLSY